MMLIIHFFHLLVGGYTCIWGFGQVDLKFVTVKKKG